tara:strand:- start:163 stop:525 length:363 start_codon:yes stop_codon:yes gene_type:complete
MDEREQEIRKSHRRWMFGTVLGLIAVSIIGSKSRDVWDSYRGNYLQPEDFQKAEWIKCSNEDERIWDNYMGEDIKHNSTNWYAYQEEVKKENVLRGTPYPYLYLPDLDGDGEVRQRDGLK